VTQLSVSTTSSAFWRSSWFRNRFVPSGGEVDVRSLGEFLGVVNILGEQSEEAELNAKQ